MVLHLHAHHVHVFLIAKSTHSDLNLFYTDLLQVVNFACSLQIINKLQQVCQFHQVATSLLKSGLLQFVTCTLFTTCWNNLQQAC